uniref:Ammonium transporter n=2 Tax=Macrostomum lignano TaxID=282301 RepID=A0A1I8GAW9_9PLAT
SVHVVRYFEQGPDALPVNPSVLGGAPAARCVHYSHSNSALLWTVKFHLDQVHVWRVSEPTVLRKFPEYPHLLIPLRGLHKRSKAVTSRDEIFLATIRFNRLTKPSTSRSAVVLRTVNPPESRRSSYFCVGFDRMELSMNSSLANSSLSDVLTGNSSGFGNVTTIAPVAEKDTSNDDATWILTSSFIIFTMQSGKRHFDKPCYIIASMAYNSATENQDLNDDAVWILACSFIIFTMQTGFGLLEAGNVQVKNEVNIMVKNVVDVVFGGMSYWMFGYALSFGQSGGGGFCGWGEFFMDRSPGDQDMGVGFATFVFQLSFATTATTIVSGAMAERTRLDAYILFSFLNTLVYCIPAHWVWDRRGFLKQLGAVDIAGSGCVHFIGAVSAAVAALLLGPRLGRYDENSKTPRGGNPTNALIGMFMLWWGWLAFNCGSTFGISNGKWKLAAKAAATTLNASMGGGLSGIVITYIINKGKFEVCDIVNAILASLVSITAGCSIVRAWEAVVIGIIGGIIAIPSAILMDKIHLDDPVGAVAVHGFAGVWGMLACGIFVDVDPLQNMNNGQKGLFHGGGFYLLGVQLLACVCLGAWSAGVTFVTLGTLKLTIGIRLSPEEELLGSDFVEHNIPNEEHVASEVPPEFLNQARQRRFSALLAKNWTSDSDLKIIEEENAGASPDVNGEAHTNLAFDEEVADDRAKSNNSNNNVCCRENRQQNSL